MLQLDRDVNIFRQLRSQSFHLLEYGRKKLWKQQSHRQVWLRTSRQQDRQLRYKSCNGTAGYCYPSWNLYHLHYIFFPLGMYIKDELKVNHFQFYIVKTHLSPNRHHPMGIP